MTRRIKTRCIEGGVGLDIFVQYIFVALHLMQLAVMNLKVRTRLLYYVVLRTTPYHGLHSPV